MDNLTRMVKSFLMDYAFPQEPVHSISSRMLFQLVRAHLSASSEADLHFYNSVCLLYYAAYYLH